MGSQSRALWNRTRRIFFFAANLILKSLHLVVWRLIWIIYLDFHYFPRAKINRSRSSIWLRKKKKKKKVTQQDSIFSCGASVTKQYIDNTVYNKTQEVPKLWNMWRIIYSPWYVRVASFECPGVTSGGLMHRYKNRCHLLVNCVSSVGNGGRCWFTEMFDVILTGGYRCLCCFCWCGLAQLYIFMS